MPVLAERLLRVGSRTVVDDGLHNAFTDLVTWQGKLWLAYRAAPNHFGSKNSRIVLLRSEDAHTWQKAAQFTGQGEDIRDPKLAVIAGHLVLFALRNHSLDPKPYQTVFSCSDDGQVWEAFSPAAPGGWLLGKPKSAADGNWYAPGHNINQSAVRLFRMSENFYWQMHAIITQRQGADETAIEFQQDGGLLAVTRMEAGGGLFGSLQAGTMLLCAKPPYQSWETGNTCHLTRLDGPCLFTDEGQILAVGRYQPQVSGLFGKSGSVLARKRTALFRISQSSLDWLADLPSAGDTSYAGAAEWDGKVFISYYTSPPEKDTLWIAGMLAPASIRITTLEGEL